MKRWRRAPFLLVACIAGLLFFAIHQFSDFMPVVEGEQPQVNETPKAAPKSAQRTTPSERIVDYQMHVKLDSDHKKLHGRQQIKWKHPGTQPVDTIYLHLYPNAFESMDSTFMRESGGRLRDDTMPKRGFGSMEITSLETLDGDDLLYQAQFIAPDDNNPNDRTLLEVKLRKPIRPGETLALRSSFLVNLPQVFARMGYSEDFVMAGQWFPKLSAYETKGTRGREKEGWNLHQYHGNSEFYANFGTYRVRIDVPSDYIVAGSGHEFQPAEQSADGARTVYFFQAQDVHDFAWSASPHFQQAEKKIQLPYNETTLKLYLDPTHQPLEDRYFRAAQAALSRFSEWMGSYPYPTLSIVVPPHGANGAGGMEYPGLVTGWGAENETPGYELERVIIHEIGHQFFQGMIANNEFEEAWLDEAFTSYIEEKAMEEEYGLTTSHVLEASYMTHPASLTLPSWEYESHQHYAENIYIRGKLILQDIEKQIGWPAMKRVLADYFNDWQYKHPGTDDFIVILENQTGRSWRDYFNTFVFGDHMIDYAVEGVDTTFATSKQAPHYDHRIAIRRYGAAIEQVPISIGFEDGSVWKGTVNGQAENVELRLPHDQQIHWVRLDPKHDVILERRRTNQYYRNTVTHEEELRWNIGISAALELLMRSLVW